MRISHSLWAGCFMSLLMSACTPSSFDISQIHAVSKLASLEVKLDKMLFATREKKINLILGSIKYGQAAYLVNTEATLLIGIDANKLQEDDVTIETGMISIILPPIELLDFSYPSERFVDCTLYITKDKFSLEEKEEVYQKGEMAIRGLLPYLNLEEKAQDKIRLILGPVFSQMGFERIHIDFHPSADFSVDPT